MEIDDMVVKVCSPASLILLASSISLLSCPNQNIASPYETIEKGASDDVHLSVFDNNNCDADRSNESLLSKSCPEENLQEHPHDATSSLLVKQCVKHNEDIKFYCTQCSVPICGHCCGPSGSEHNGHNDVIGLVEGATAERAKIASKLLELESLVDELAAKVNSVGPILERVEANEKVLREAIERRGEEVLAAKAAALASLESRHKSQRESLGKKRELAVEASSRMRDCCERQNARMATLSDVEVCARSARIVRDANHGALAVRNIINEHESELKGILDFEISKTTDSAIQDLFAISEKRETSLGDSSTRKPGRPRKGKKAGGTEAPGAGEESFKECKQRLKKEGWRLHCSDGVDLGFTGAKCRDFFETDEPPKAGAAGAGAEANAVDGTIVAWKMDDLGNTSWCAVFDNGHEEAIDIHQAMRIRYLFMIDVEEEPLEDSLPDFNCPKNASSFKQSFRRIYQFKSQNQEQVNRELADDVRDQVLERYMGKTYPTKRRRK